MATPFAGNVPVFDVLIADEHCRSLAIQVKASTGTQWATDARLWLSLDFDTENGRQVYRGPLDLVMPDLVMACVALDMEGTKDRFFIFTASELQERIVEGYTWWMGERNWKRPRNPQSYDSRYDATDLAPFEDRWDLIAERLSCTSPNT